MDNAVAVNLQVDIVDDAAVLELQVDVGRDVVEDNCKPNVLENERLHEVFCRRLNCDLVVTGI